MKYVILNNGVLSDGDMALTAFCDRALPMVGDFDAPDFVSDLCGRKYAI